MTQAPPPAPLRTLFGEVTPPLRVVDEDRRVYGIGMAAYPLATAAFVGWIVVFGVLGLPRLSALSALGVAVWGAAALLHRRGHIPAAFALGCAQIVSFAALAVPTLGLGAGVQYWLFAPPAGVFVLPRRAAFKATVALATGLGYVTIHALNTGAVPPPSVPPFAITAMHVLNVAIVFKFLALFSYYNTELATRLQASLAEAHRRSQDLLHNILPPQIARRLEAGERTIADGHRDASVLFLDIAGFTELSASMSPERLVGLLNDVFTRIDDLVDAHGLEKIKTTGDAYVVASGVPVSRADHAEALAAFALDVLKAVGEVGERSHVPLSVRIGIHSGPLVAGVIGKRKFAYDLWGDTVNTAARMEQHGIPGAVQISEETRALLGDAFRILPRGEVEVKGKGRMRTYLLSGGRA